MKNQLLLLILLLTLAGENSIAQQSWALKPYAITLPRVTTIQQTNAATIPQQVGNVVYNTDQKAIAVHNGTSWGYLGAGDTGEFKNFTAFRGYAVWTVPQGVSRFMIEAWGGGGGGDIYQKPSPTYYGGSQGCDGGYSGAYVRKIVDAGFTLTSLTISVGYGGGGATRGNDLNRGYNATNGGHSIVSAGSFTLVANGGYITGGTGAPYGSDNFPGNRPLIIPGNPPKGMEITYGQVSSTEFVKVIKGGCGGTAFGVAPNIGGFGHTFSVRPASTTYSSVVDFETVNEALSDGSYPGGGGGCEFFYAGNGGSGLVIIRW